MGTVRVYIDWYLQMQPPKWGAVIYINYPKGVQPSDAILTGQRTLFKQQSWGKALIYAAHSIKNKVCNITQEVFLTGALSVLNCASLAKRQATSNWTCFIHTTRLTVVLQFIPSHCGVWGNEQPDTLQSMVLNNYRKKPQSATQRCKLSSNLCSKPHIKKIVTTS